MNPFADYLEAVMEPHRASGPVVAQAPATSHGVEVEVRYFTVAEAARMLGVSRMTMYRKIHAGIVRANKVGRKLRVFAPDIEKMSKPVYLSNEEVD